MYQKVLPVFLIAASTAIGLAACSPASSSGPSQPAPVEDGGSSQTDSSTTEFSGSQMVIGQDKLAVVPPAQTSSGNPSDITRLEIAAGEMQNGLCNAQISIAYANEQAKQRLLTADDSDEIPLLEDVFQVADDIEPGNPGHGEVAEGGSVVKVDFRCATSTEPQTNASTTFSSSVFTDIEAEGDGAFRWAFTMDSTGAIIPTETGQLDGNRMTFADDGAFVQD